MAEKSGQGNKGQGQGAGSGAGNGTSLGKEEVNPTKPSGGLSSKNSSEKKIGEYEKIFSSQTLGGDGKKAQLKGKKNGGGSTDIVIDKAQTFKGQQVPYNKVIGNYKNEALDSIKSSEIPEGMKQIVKDYFNSIDE